jgi:hypothetical protein
MRKNSAQCVIGFEGGRAGWRRWPVGLAAGVSGGSGFGGGNGHGTPDSTKWAVTDATGRFRMTVQADPLAGFGRNFVP